MNTFNSLNKFSHSSAKMAAVIGLALSGAAQAAPLMLGTPLISYDTGTTTYNATSGAFAVTALPSNMFDPTMSPPVGFISPATSSTETVSVNIVIDSMGTLIGGVVGDDLVIEGSVTLFPAGIPTPYNGVLLTGEVVSFGADDVATTTDTYNLTFSVTGGLLSSYYPNNGVGINLISENSTATGDFTVDFNGGAKGQLGDQDVIVIPDACTVEVTATCQVEGSTDVPTTTCEIPPSGAGCFANGKPTSMTFEYTGGGCIMSDSEALSEGLKAPTCTGVIDESLVASGDTVTITAPGLTVTPSSVKLGDTFTVSGAFESSTTIVLTDAIGATETHTIHTSCSAPLEVGDVFGGMSMTLYNGQYGGTNVDFFYKVTNTGTTGITNVLVDDVFLGDVPGSPIASMTDGEMQTLTRTISLINSVENPVTASAVNGNAVCDSTSSATVHEAARPDQPNKGSKGSKRGSKKMGNKNKKGSHKSHERTKDGHLKGSKGVGHYSGDHSGCSHN